MRVEWYLCDIDRKTDLTKNLHNYMYISFNAVNRFFSNLFYRLVVVKKIETPFSHILRAWNFNVLLRRTLAQKHRHYNYINTWNSLVEATIVCSENIALVKIEVRNVLIVIS